MKEGGVAVAWMGASQGIFRLHDSDAWCGSYLTLADAAEVLGTGTAALKGVPAVTHDGEVLGSELDLYRAWGRDGLRARTRRGSLG